MKYITKEQREALEEMGKKVEQSISTQLLLIQREESKA